MPRNDLSIFSSLGARKLSFQPAAIARFLVYVIAFLFCAHTVAFVCDYVVRSRSGFSRNMVRYFDFNLENNFPAYFSVLLLAFSAFLLFIIYAANRTKKGGRANYWFVLGLLFVFLSIDECIQIHEHIAELVRPKLSSDISGLLYWSWVVVYAVLVVVVVVSFLRFVFDLPKATRNLFFLSGVMFVSGALGMELLEGYFYKLGYGHILNRMLFCLEELLEMGGVTVFIYALLNYIMMAKISINIIADANVNTSTVVQEKAILSD